MKRPLIDEQIHRQIIENVVVPVQKLCKLPSIRRPSIRDHSLVDAARFNWHSVSSQQFSNLIELISVPVSKRHTGPDRLLYHLTVRYRVCLSVLRDLRQHSQPALVDGKPVLKFVVAITLFVVRDVQILSDREFAFSPSSNFVLKSLKS
jgi:hypothetical protein